MVQGPRIEIISTDKEFDMVFHIPKLILGLCQNEKTTVSTCKSEFFKFSGIDNKMEATNPSCSHHRCRSASCKLVFGATAEKKLYFDKQGYDIMIS